MSKTFRTRAQWARAICATHKATVQNIFKMGRLLSAAKKKLQHGEFTTMIESDLPFGKRTAQMLMAVAADARLAKANHGSLLPATWRCLYELHKLPDAVLEQAITTGKVHPQMTRSDVRTITIRAEPTRPHLTYTPRIVRRATEVTYRPPVTSERTSAAIAASSRTVELATCLTLVRDKDADDDTSAPVLQASDFQPFATLHQIEQLVGELGWMIERGEVTINAGFAMRAQSVAEQLQAMANRYMGRH